MTAALTPERGLELLALLSLDVRSGVVVDRRGAVLAGDRRLAGAARDPRTAGPGTVAVGHGGHAIALELGPHAVLALVLHDVATVLEALS